ITVWVDQWPLSKEKLVALHELVQEQLQQGHIEPSMSPWNTPVFVIKKKSGKWLLLPDLRKINAVMASMGALQAGMPPHTMTPSEWDILIVDLKDCFFTIPLHPKDIPKFAFTVPSVKHAEPVKQYQWKLLPQGMKNSPTICQWYVAQALSTIREQFPGVYCCHYMDDILVATPTKEELLQIQPHLLRALHNYGLQIAREKVQSQVPWRYLGVKILEQTVQPQNLQFKKSIWTLNDAQKLLGLTTVQLSPLFNILKGDSELTSLRKLTPEAERVLEEVQQAISNHQVYRVDLTTDIVVFLVTPDLHPTGIIGQWNDQWPDPLYILEWVFLPHQPKKTAPMLFELIAQLIIKCRQRCLQLIAKDLVKIVLPIQQEYFGRCFANCDPLQSALQNFLVQIVYHLPSHKLLQLAKSTSLSLWPKNSRVPLQRPTIFTDGSGRTGKAIVTWRDESGWQVLEGHQSGSAQLVELRAVTTAFQRLSHVPLNLVTDSAYVAGITQCLDCSLLKEVNNAALFSLLKALWCAIQNRVHPYYVLHVRSHTSLPG
ncbi:POK11 protein, partial [Melanocharis versteri]|nr:POK11 protein [Melanocharis versteri]